MKGRRFKFANDSDGEEDIYDGLDVIGISDEKDRQDIFKKIKKVSRLVILTFFLKL